MLGYRSDIPEILNIMDIFCLTSLKEGLPISLIEAMSVGRPVIGTDVDGIRDVIVHNKNGFLVCSGDVNDLKESMITLLNNEALCQKMGRESKSMTKEYYSLDRCVTQYHDLFMSSLKHKRDS
jgi:glycosyltransferase involved in cell wall biosynthesis